MRKEAVAYTDGGNRGTPGPYACAVVLHLDGEVVEDSAYLGPSGTNNRAEVEGIIMALRLAAQLGVTHLTVRCDSQLTVEQVLGNWRIKDTKLRVLHDEARRIALESFEEVKIDHVPREENILADSICTRVLDSVTGRPRGSSSGRSKQTLQTGDSSL